MPDKTVTFRDVEKILIVKFLHIGDVLLTTPTIRAFRETFPEATISVAVNLGTEEVLSDNPAVSEVIVVDRKIKQLTSAKKYLKEIAFLKAIRDKGFDMTVDLTGGDRAAIVSLLSGARYRIALNPKKKGFPGKKFLYTHLADIDKKKHMVLQNLDIAKQFGIITDNTDVDFFISAELETSVEDIFQKHNINDNDTIVHIHPTSLWMFKCWKDEYMAETISWLIEQGTKVIITSSPDSKEINKVDSILNCASLKKTDFSSNILNLAGKTFIRQLGAISKAADIFLGVDSAPMHIAAAVGTPVIAIFGPSRVFNWGPWNNCHGPQSNTYNISGLQTFGIHTVVQRDWDCVPCDSDGCNSTKQSKCIEDIKPDEIKSIFMKKMNK